MAGPELAAVILSGVSFVTSVWQVVNDFREHRGLAPITDIAGTLLALLGVKFALEAFQFSIRVAREALPLLAAIRTGNADAVMAVHGGSNQLKKLKEIADGHGADGVLGILGMVNEAADGKSSGG